MNQDKKKKKINTAVFFSLLLWLIVYLVVIKSSAWISPSTPWVWVIVALLQAIFIVLAEFFVPAFEFILKITSKIGTLIFAVLTTCVFYFILTPIALFKRLTGKPLLNVKIDKSKSSYYEEWEISPNVEKQY